jgi:hypothetical protein
MKDPNAEKMSQRERVCFARQLEAALDNDDPGLADYWKQKGLQARQERLFPDVAPAAEGTTRRGGV